MKVAIYGTFSKGSSKANAINTIKTALGFQNAGCQVTIFCFGRRSWERGMQNDYGITDSTSIQWVLVSPIFRLFFPSYWLWIIAHRSLKSLNPDIVYARDYVIPLFSSNQGYASIVETHAFVNSTNRSFLRLMKEFSTKPQLRTLVTISPQLANYYEGLGVP